jgi:hypothetical protein
MCTRLWSARTSVPARAHQHFSSSIYSFPTHPVIRQRHLANIRGTTASRMWNNIFNSYPILFIRIKFNTTFSLTPLFPVWKVKKNKQKNRMAASILEEQFDQKHIYLFFALSVIFKISSEVEGFYFYFV